MNIAQNVVLLLLVFLSACTSENENVYSFYHWKSNALYSETIAEAIRQCQTVRIYLHYFDIIKIERGGIYPTYILDKVATEFKNMDIVPVVFITEEVLKGKSAHFLSEKIHSLVDEISQFHFNKTFPEIQLDCDWTESSMDNYFELLELLQPFYEVSTTIRLHQIKYKERTGIPPVEKGVLMLYNVGDLANMQQNSILESNIVAAYVNKETDYPLVLDLALPLFSQTVIFNNAKQIRLINGVNKSNLERDKKHFKKVDDFLFEVVKDTLYNGFYLNEKYTLKLEEISHDEIVSSYQIIKNSQINPSSIIFYHLDEDVLNNVNLDKLLKQL